MAYLTTAEACTRAFRELRVSRSLRAKPYASMGRYLVGHGAVTEEQLKEAILVQREDNALIAAIALIQGLLERPALNRLISLRTETGGDLGRLAVEEGFMTEAGLEAVLAIQGQNHFHLAEALVRLGIVTRDMLDQALEGFHSEIVAQVETIADEIGHLPAAAEVLATLDATLRFFFRLGHPVRVVGSNERLSADFEYLFCSEQVFKTAGIRYMALGIDAMLVESITHGPTLRERSDKQKTDAMEAMSQIVFNLNYTACKRMRKQGARVRHGDAFIEVPNEPAAGDISLELELMASPVVLSCGQRRPACPIKLRPFAGTPRSR